jgi:hypothetical protein
VLSRTADNLFWLARYMERADYAARTLDAGIRLTSLPRTYGRDGTEWRSALAATGTLETFNLHYGDVSEANVIEFMLFDTRNTSSIGSCIAAARRNARAVRTALTAETWESINTGWIELRRIETQRRRGDTIDRENLSQFLDFAKKLSLDFDGSAYRTMLRNDMYWPRPVHRTRRQYRPHPRREIPSPPAGERERRLLARLFPVGGDPARGLGADRLSLGLPARHPALARRRPPDSQP